MKPEFLKLLLEKFRNYLNSRLPLDLRIDEKEIDNFIDTVYESEDLKKLLTEIYNENKEDLTNV